MNDSTDENDDEDESSHLPTAPLKRFVSCHNAEEMENAFNLMSTSHSRQQTQTETVVSSLYYAFKLYSHQKILFL